MELSYLLISFLGFIYFFFKKRFFDFLTIGFISQQLYFVPCLTQTLFPSTKLYLFPVNHGVYLTGSMLITSFMLFSFNLNVSERMYRNSKYIDWGFKYHAFYATLIALIAFLISYLQVGTILFTSAKAEVLNSIDRFYILWAICSLYGLACAYFSSKWIYFWINLILIIITIYIGFRSIAAISVISLIVLYFVNKQVKINLLINYYQNIFLGVLAGIFFLVYKGLYIAIKFQNYDLVFERLLSVDFYKDVLINAEPFGIQRIFSDIIFQDFFIGLENLNRFFLMFTLFSNESGIDSRSFNDYFQPSIYGDVGYGMGSNVWAHMYSSGGWLLLIIFILFYSLSLRWFSKIIYSGNINYTPLLVVLGSYWAFYIHRNDLFYQLGLERRILLVFLLISFLSIITKTFVKTRIITFKN